MVRWSRPQGYYRGVCGELARPAGMCNIGGRTGRRRRNPGECVPRVHGIRADRGVPARHVLEALVEYHRNVAINTKGRTPTPVAQDRSSSPVLFVVDDDLLTLELLQEVAHESGWQTVGFTRLAPLRAALDKRRPTFLIVDDDLPDGRGADLVRDL